MFRLRSREKLALTSNKAVLRDWILVQERVLDLSRLVWNGCQGFNPG